MGSCLSGGKAAQALPEEVYQKPAKAGEEGQAGKACPLDEEVCEQGPEADVAEGSQEGDAHPLDAVVVAGIGVAGVAEDVEEGDEAKVAGGLHKGRALCEKQGKGRGGGREEQEAKDAACAGQEKEALAEGFSDLLPVPGPVGLGEDDGGGGGPAVPDGVDKALQAAGGGEGQDGSVPREPTAPWTKSFPM